MRIDKSLNVVEELLLLAISEDGRLPPDEDVLDYGWVAGVLLELSLKGRIDTDLDKLIVLNMEPVGDRCLDRVLAELTSTGRQGDVSFWLGQLCSLGADIREKTLFSLTEKGVIARREKRLLGLFRSVRYTVVDQAARNALTEKVARALRSNEIPEPRLCLLICLADACGLLDRVLDGEELSELEERIEVIRRLELIGLVASRAADDIRSSLRISIRSQRR